MSFDTIDVQFEKIINSRMKSLQEKAGGKVAHLFTREMKQNVDRSTGFGGDKFDSKYSDSYLKQRVRKGHPKGNVILKAGNRRINQTQIKTTAQETTVSFPDGGEIFNYHHTGRAKGGKIRSIWPKSPESIPETLKNRVKETVAEVLRGQK